MDATFVELVEMLTRQRLQLERMLYRTVTLRALSIGGHARFLAWASDDLEAAANAVAQSDLRRDALYRQLAQTHGLEEAFSFDQLARLADPTYQVLVEELRSQIGALVPQLRHNLALVREEAAEGESTASDLIARLSGVDPTQAHLHAGPEAGIHIDTRL